jgi:hypothetical protein
MNFQQINSTISIKKMQRLNDKKKLPECDIKKETIGFTTTYASVPITTNVVS